MKRSTPPPVPPRPQHCTITKQTIGYSIDHHKGWRGSRDHFAFTLKGAQAKAQRLMRTKSDPQTWTVTPVS